MSPYQDTFVNDALPAANKQAEYLLDDPLFATEEHLNCAEQLLDKHILFGHGQNPCLRTDKFSWTYRDVYEKANQIARVLIEDYDLKSGNRVLLRSANNPMLVACWYGVIKAGGVVVTTMPLLRATELEKIIDCAEISHALCDYRLEDDLKSCTADFLQHICCFDGSDETAKDLELRMLTKDKQFENYKSRADDVAIIGFTSGTTGMPKMTAHFHRDMVNICKAYPPYALQLTPDDVVTGSPPIGFTFGLGGLVLFPMFYGASSFLMEKPGAEEILKSIEKHKITVCFTAPTAWRVLTAKVENFDISSLRRCISAGEALPKQVWDDWHEKTGLKILDGIGATELLHIFIASNTENVKPGATGVPIPGYQAIIVDKDGREVGVMEEGRLAVKGITGCKYLNRKEKQKEYVQNHWNLTGDIFKKDEDGYFHYVSRSDDMIISSGYNISSVVVENVLLQHPDIFECAVVGLPDAERGMIVAAHIVLQKDVPETEEKIKEIQDWFKANAAPYKYPRKIFFRSSIPKTLTGKIQRYMLKNPEKALNK